MVGQGDPGLADSPVDVFTIIERTCSVFSLLGSMLVIATFSLSKAFHKPINRLVFYASFGNLLTNVATLIARTFINNIDSAGCQFQAFLIQMFMPADAFWTLAMAVNVYLTFYFKFDAQRLRRMEVPYLLLCYGIPFIVALVLIFISTPEKGRMYGNATLWCWIAPKWDVFRIAIFYGPVWIVILVTFFIYIRAGRDIYKKHRQLKEFSISTTRHDAAEFPAPPEDLFSSTKTTEVFVTTEVIDKPGAIDLAPLGGGGRRNSETLPPPKPAKAAYSVTISSNRHREPFDEPDGLAQGTTMTVEAQPHAAGLTRVTSHATSATVQNKTTTIATGTTTLTSSTGNAANANPLRRRAAYEANNATWSYTKCAILFFTAMLVTWIPSSANRVYSVVHSGQASLALEYMSSFVLPLQGFWNAIIYVVTSWGACKMLWEDIRAWCGASGRRGRRGRRGLPDPHELMPGGGVGMHLHRSTFQMMESGKNGRKASDSKTYETESMTELAASRPGSSGSPTTGAATPTGGKMEV
ncbi:family A G protein-coupled receptor-like protein [Parathielavia appendiculata]|uniref:Family A G protein-coupled receptor-like protein n=1 Tax=Parathielavia appendiculata TaxID=2587402 RepID=A0AAN6U6U0_9PEZI|nr:family A G protein-coupled receptor-like protein [Parathielavia appendiculata]